MRHGIDAYFRALERDRRRIALLGTAVAVVFLVGELLAMRPRVIEALNDPRRFGFEGPEQFVRRILLETVGNEEQAGANTQNIVPVELRAGGGERKTSARGEGLATAAKRQGEGPGEDELNLQSRMRALALQGPVIRSEDLVVEKLVRPEYPEEARARDIEGNVELVALVDTTGSVLEVHILGGTHDPMLERAATDAVLQCRYRPYRFNDYLQRVWAYFRISFTLY